MTEIGHDRAHHSRGPSSGMGSNWEELGLSKCLPGYPLIVLQNSFWITEDKFSGLRALRSNNRAEGPQQLVMNSPATSVARLRTHRSGIIARLLFSRKNRWKPFLEFCKISHWKRTLLDTAGKPQRCHNGTCAAMEIV